MDDFLDEVGGYMDSLFKKKLLEAEIMVKDIPRSAHPVEVQVTLMKANSIIALVCGDDNDLYEEYRYRLFKTTEEKLLIVQGEELDTDPQRMFSDIDGLDT